MVATMRSAFMIGWLALAACSEGGRTEGSFGSVPGDDCIPGEQRACACPGGVEGAQVCAPMGDHFEPCQGCDDGGVTSTGAGTDASTGAGEGGATGATAAATTGSTGDVADTSSGGESSSSAASTGEDVGPCAGHCNNGITDCGEPHTDCGGDCPVTAEYTFCDCLYDTPRNGSEVCDDSGFTVPDNPPPGVLVCLEATGGQIYIATNTSIDPNDMVPRCSGWELMGQNAWDHLDYVVPALTCDAVQKTQPFDISGFAGQDLWFGAHNHPNGGGSGTTACIAVAK
jgi:hypothetical protein